MEKKRGSVQPGEKHGLLTVIKYAYSKNKKKYFECLCECGNTCIAQGFLLKNGKIKSCSCLAKSVQPGEKYGLLTVINYSHSKDRLKYFECACECGNNRIIRGAYLTSQVVKSCGCLKFKQHPKITSAKSVWSHNYKEIPFDIFYGLSQLPCHYCGSLPQTNYNLFTSQISSKYREINGSFIYNGLDRIDSLNDHNIYNCVPCCSTCNWAKVDYSYPEFITWISNIISYQNNNFYSDISHYLPLSKYQISSAKTTWRKQYQELPFEDFLLLSQQNCYYCGIEPFCRINNYENVRLGGVRGASDFAVEHGTFVYNGLDRVDNNKGHFKDNVVSCCKWCNYTKRDLSLLDFLKVIENFYFSPIFDNPIDSPIVTWAEILTLYPERDGAHNIVKSRVNTYRRRTEIDKIKIAQLITSSCVYCGKAATNSDLNGIDRRDNDLAYIEGNYFPACKICNYSKRERTLEQFLVWVRKIKEYQAQTQSIEKLIKTMILPPPTLP